MVSLVAHDGGHGTIGEVDGGVADAAPQQIGNKHIDDAKGHGRGGDKGLVHQEGSQRHRAAGAQKPWLELAVLRRLCFVTDPAHGGIRESVHNTGKQEHGADQTGVDSQHVRVEYLQEQAGKDKGKIIAYVADQVADFVSPAEGTESCCLFAHNIAPYFGNICANC